MHYTIRTKNGVFEIYELTEQLPVPPPAGEHPEVKAARLATGPLQLSNNEDGLCGSCSFTCKSDFSIGDEGNLIAPDGKVRRIRIRKINGTHYTAELLK